MCYLYLLRFSHGEMCFCFPFGFFWLFFLKLGPPGAQILVHNFCSKELTVQQQRDFCLTAYEHACPHGTVMHIAHCSQVTCVSQMGHTFAKDPHEFTSICITSK